MEKVNHPKHYANGQYECIDVMIDVFGIEAVENFCALNAFKYLWRAKQKNGTEDIQKAIWYLNKLNELDCKGANNMPTEKHNYELKLGYVDENGNVHEVKFLTDIPVLKDWITQHQEEEETTSSTAEMVAERAMDHLKAFLNVGFDGNKAFALTRDWFKIEMERIYDDATKN